MGTVGARYTEHGRLSAFPALDESRHRLAAVAGTSTCHLVQVSVIISLYNITLSIELEQARGFRKRCLGSVQGETTDHRCVGSELNRQHKDAAFPGWWMNEGGQSSTGQLIDFVITTHAAYPELQERAKQAQKNIHQGQPYRRLWICRHSRY